MQMTTIDWWKLKARFEKEFHSEKPNLPLNFKFSKHLRQRQNFICIPDLLNMAGVNNNLQFETSKEVTVYFPSLIHADVFRAPTCKCFHLPVCSSLDANFLVSRGYGIKRCVLPASYSWEEMADAFARGFVKGCLCLWI